jgi:deoxyinosine 3'endonuclease (endonuclease V)
MDIHPWNITTEEATAIQLRLAGQVSRTNGISEEARYVVGTDISPPDDDDMAYGAAVVMGPT